MIPSPDDDDVPEMCRFFNNSLAALHRIGMMKIPGATTLASLAGTTSGCAWAAAWAQRDLAGAVWEGLGIQTGTAQRGGSLAQAQPPPMGKNNWKA